MSALYERLPEHGRVDRWCGGFDVRGIPGIHFTRIVLPDRIDCGAVSGCGGWHGSCSGCRAGRLDPGSVAGSLADCGRADAKNCQGASSSRPKSCVDCCSGLRWLPWLPSCPTFLPTCGARLGARTNLRRRRYRQRCHTIQSGRQMADRMRTSMIRPDTTWIRSDAACLAMSSGTLSARSIRHALPARRSWVSAPPAGWRIESASAMVRVWSIVDHFCFGDTTWSALVRQSHTDAEIAAV